MTSILLALSTLTLGSGHFTPPVAVDRWLIVPGRSIGKIQLGEQQAAVFAEIGRPDPRAGYEGDTAMGRSWIVYKGKSGHELDVYTVRGVNDSAAHPEQFVRQVRVDSPLFHMKDGTKVGSLLEAIHLALSHTMTSKSGLGLWDCQAGGIAFEVKRDPHGRWRCSAIVIHEKGKSILNAYNRFLTTIPGS